MKHFLFSISLALFSISASAQDNFVKIDPCTQVEHFVPDTLGYTPIKRVRLVLHIFSKEDSSGNFRNRPADLDFIQTIFNHMQWHYRETEPLRDAAPAYYHIVDSRIRMHVDTIIWHLDNDAWNFKKYVTYYEEKTKDSTGFNQWNVRGRCEQLYTKYVRNNEDLNPKLKDSALHIFFLEVALHPDKGMAESFNSKKWAYFTGAYHPLLPPDPPTDISDLSR